MAPEVTPPEDLRALVRTRLDELDTSARQAARNSGGAISYEWLLRILKGRHAGTLTERGAAGIAAALQVPVGRVWEAVGRSEPEPWDWPSQYNVLGPRDREIVEQVAARLAVRQREIDAWEAGR